MSFESDIKAFQAKALLAANKAVCKVVEEVFTGAVTHSPSPISDPQAKFSRGLLINQWYPQVGGFSTEQSTATNDYGSSSLSRIKATVAAMPFYGKDNIVTLTNNVDHAYRAEVLGWPEGKDPNSNWNWTGMVMPYGMVRKSVEAVRGAYI